MHPTNSTNEQLNNLIGFRQAIYAHGLTGYRDAQFELVEAMLNARPTRSFVEFSLAPTFQRGWSSAYAAVSLGGQDEAWWAHYCVQQLPSTGVQVMAVDTTVWSHPSARTLPDLTYEYSPSQGREAVVGHQYSLLAWVPEREGRWALPLDMRRVPASEKAVDMAVQQVRQLCERYRGDPDEAGLLVVVADGSYGNHHFFGPLRSLPVAVAARMRSNRVLYGPPPAYGGRGRRRLHGRCFAFHKPDSWGDPDESDSFDDSRWGRVRLHCWHGLHAKQDPDTPLSVIRAEVHLERDRPPEPLWLGYQGATGFSATEVWGWFAQRWPIESHFRFRKQRLHWTQPAFQALDRCERWTRLVDIAYWQLYLARDLVADQPLPWQKPQSRLTPGRVLQGMSLLFRALGTPTRPPQTRGKGAGWPRGRPRRPPPRYPPQKRRRKRA